jgi:hypothetical protein
MRVLVGALAVLLAGIGSVSAQIPIDTTPDADEQRNIFTLQIENDVFNRIGKSDRDYTNGIRFGWLSPALPSLPDGVARLLTFPTFFGEGDVQSVTRRSSTTGPMPPGSMRASRCNRPTSASIPRPTRKSRCGSTRSRSMSAWWDRRRAASSCRIISIA